MELYKENKFMKIGEWFQINEKHSIPRDQNIVYMLFEIYFKYFWISFLKDKYGYELYFRIWFIDFAYNKIK
jgi:hypothetical protein